MVMLEAGGAASKSPGVHLRNTMSDVDFNRTAMAMLVPHGGSAPIHGLPGTKGIHAVGGMLTAWSHAVPRPQIPAEWDGPVSEQELTRNLSRAESLLWATDSLAGDESQRQHWVGNRIADATGNVPMRVPIAARRTVLGRVEYAGAAALFDPENVDADVELRIVTGVVVRRVEHQDGRATSVVMHHSDLGELRASGAIVVVGAGAVGTPQLLHASGLRHPALGRYATDHLNVVSTVCLDASAPASEQGDAAMNLYLPVTEERPFHTAILDLPSVAHTGIAMGDDSSGVTNLGTFIGTDPVRHNGLRFHDDELDNFGLPRVSAQMELTDDDHARSAQVLAEHYELARVLGDPAHGMTSFVRPYGSALHLMGTYRMGSDADTSVLDSTGKVRGTSNIYAVGNGVLPSRNSANPTLTTVALALRTADHLANGDAE